jgi:hypothetical protein
MKTVLSIHSNNAKLLSCKNEKANLKYFRKVFLIPPNVVVLAVKSATTPNLFSRPHYHSHSELSDDPGLSYAVAAISRNPLIIATNTLQGTKYNIAVRKIMNTRLVFQVNTPIARRNAIPSRSEDITAFRCLLRRSRLSCRRITGTYRCTKPTRRSS